jgi:hypothetical protein
MKSARAGRIFSISGEISVNTREIIMYMRDEDSTAHL